MTEQEVRDAVAMLARDAWRREVGEPSISPLAGDASSRRYYRVAWSAAPVATAVLMVVAGSGLSISSDELSSIGDVSEMPFLNVQRWLAANAIAVPAVYAADSARGLALLEDVGDTTLWDAASAASDPLTLYRHAIDGIVELQLAGRTSADERCIAFRQRFDRTLFAWEFDHFLEYGFGVTRPSADDEAALRAAFGTLAERLAAAPAAIAHRDYHSWNLFVQAGRIRTIDFQDALYAPITYDLASLLTDRRTPRLLTPERERELVGYFERRLAEPFGATDPAVDVRRLYHETALQRALKVVGRFHFLEEVKGKSGYVAMLPDTLATVRRCLDALPELGAVRAILARSFTELA
jgi:aminoglycoside/choline kinase family phosphotransferase